MTFVLRMALREIRASWQRLLFFFVCIAVGVASIVAIRSVIQSVREGLTREARAMTGADVVVRSDRPLGDDDSRGGGRANATSGRVGIVSEAVEIATMVRPPNVDDDADGRTARGAVGVSALRHDDAAGRPYSHALLRDHGTLVRPELLAQLNLRVGDDLLIGTQRFQIRGVIQSEPGRNLGRVLARLARLHRSCRSAVDRTAVVRQPCVVPAAAAGAGSAAACPGVAMPSTLLARDLSKAFVNDFVARPVVSAERRPHDPEPDAGRELPEPRRARRADSRRHRRLERDARVRAAEGAKHRHPEVRREHDATGAQRSIWRRCCCSGWPAARWAWRLPASRCCAAAGVRRRSRRAAAGRVRADGGRRPAGTRRRHARVGAVLGRAAARESAT